MIMLVYITWESLPQGAETIWCAFYSDNQEAHELGLFATSQINFWINPAKPFHFIKIYNSRIKNIGLLTEYEYWGIFNVAKNIINFVFKHQRNWDGGKEP